MYHIDCLDEVDISPTSALLYTMETTRYKPNNTILIITKNCYRLSMEIVTITPTTPSIPDNTGSLLQTVYINFSSERVGTFGI